MMKVLLKFSKKRSFALVELIMTVVVVGIIALPISVTLSKHIQSVFISQDYTLTLNLARFEMETVLNTAYASIAVGTSSVIDYQGYVHYDLSKTVTETTSGAQGYKFITVSVAKDTGTISATLKTYVVKNVTWGL
mgnify:FL=1